MRSLSRSVLSVASALAVGSADQQVNERELAAELRLSLRSVREAMRCLERLGAIRAQPNLVGRPLGGILAPRTVHLFADHWVWMAVGVSR
jgi:hypothetical protein